MNDAIRVCLQAGPTLAGVDISDAISSFPTGLITTGGSTSLKRSVRRITTPNATVFVPEFRGDRQDKAAKPHNPKPDNHAERASLEPAQQTWLHDTRRRRRAKRRGEFC